MRASWGFCWAAVCAGLGLTAWRDLAAESLPPHCSGEVKNRIRTCLRTGGVLERGLEADDFYLEN